MGRNYAPSTIDVIGDLANGLHAETTTYNTATYWKTDGASPPIGEQHELFNVYGRILVLQLYIEMVTASGGGAALLQFNATFSDPVATVEPISNPCATTATMLAGGRIVWLGGVITSIPTVTVLLGGAISPLDGVGPENLTIQPLVERVEKYAVEEIILATNQTPEGEATAAFIARALKSKNIKISCLARGLPVGSSIGNVDRLTVYKALSERRPF